MSSPVPAPAPPSGLHYWDAYWDHRPAECPCDQDFVLWLDEMAVRDAAIFHFGTGGHHHVGIECARPDRRNAVLGITAAPKELDTFVELAIARPDVLRHYNVLFGDIYLLNSRLLPVFDVVTLFHLCEFRGEKNDAYGGMTDLDLTRLLTDHVRPGGHILFFPGSYAWARANDSAKDVVAAWEEGAGVERVGLSRSLLVYRKAA
ncbi:hypothetical protein [uncultured Enterovirga sp.]|uniref:hypothetical protein n=1 Tax=uncultured Enterovirga sp. TaxID=2026352 RepID=UPI0035CC0BEC